MAYTVIACFDLLAGFALFMIAVGCAVRSGGAAVDDVFVLVISAILLQLGGNLTLAARGRGK